MTDDPDPAGDAGSLSPVALRERLRRGDAVTLLDVRDRDEFEAWHIDGEHVDATQIPHNKFLVARVRGGVEALVADLAEPILVVCGEGKASGDVADLLAANGLEALNLEGGMEGWARVYESVELPHDEATVRQYLRPSSGCVATLVVAGDDAVVVDPLRAFADRYVADAAELGAEISYAVDTHVHADHVSGVRDVARETGATIVLPRGADERGLAFDATLVGDGDTLGVGDAELTAVALPGHTTEMTGFRVGDLLLAGDSVFLDSVARPDLEVGDDGAAEMARTLYGTLHERLFAFPAETRVVPGHVGDRTKPDDAGRYVATLAALRGRLDVLTLDGDAFVERILANMPPQPANYETIIETNLGRRETDDAEAFELELGPNNCAATGTAD